MVSFERDWWSMHAKYEVPISYSSKVMAKVKVDNRQTNKQTGQNQYAQDHSNRRHKKPTSNSSILQIYPIFKIIYCTSSYSLNFIHLRVNQIIFEYVETHAKHLSSSELYISSFKLEWQHFKECMCHLQNMKRDFY